MLTAFLRLCALALFWSRVVSAAELVSGGGAGGSTQPSISGDGRLVAFTSVAKLSPEDTNALPDVYVRDRESGTVRLVSDNRGGDQPIISANGRFVVFRALETFPKLRVVDLETQEPPRTVSFPQDTGFSFRYADSAAISPEGRFIAFPFRTIPGVANGSAVDLYVVDTTVADRTSDAAADSLTKNFPVDTLGRSAMARDGNTFFTETRDRVLPNNDKNDAQDIYKIIRGSNSVVRVSAVTDGALLVNNDEAPAEKLKGARDPVLTADGTSVFFITARRLREGDKDGRATIYRSAAGSNFQIPTPVPTPGVTPISMSRQAVGDGQCLVFLGHADAGGIKPYLLRVSDGKLMALAPSVQMEGLPVISADNGVIAFSSTAALNGADHNGKGDVYVVPNPFNGTPLAPPVVTLTATAGGVKTQPFSATLGAQASSAAGIVFTRIELDGVQIADSDSGPLASANYPIPRGVHTVRAVALDRNNLTTYSAAVTYTVRPPANNVLFSPPATITRSGQAGGREITFTGTVRIDNTTAAAKPSLQVVLTQAPNDAKWESFGNDVPAAMRDVQILGVITVPGIAANSTGEVNISGITLPPEVLGGQHFRGVGWTIGAKLVDVTSPTTATLLDTLTLFQIRPRLDEGTPGPNGGTPVLGGAGSDGGFTPATVNSITINPGTPVVLAERTRRAFTAAASFTQGGATSSRPVTPKWSVITGGAPVTIAANGVLTAGDVATPRTVTLQAAFGGKTSTLNVTVRPRSPAVSVRAPFPLVSEDDQTFFRILRSPLSNEPLDVSYTVGGLASHPFRTGVDFTPLTGTATIGANAAFVDVPMVPTADILIEGNESVILTLAPSGEYRLGAMRTATIVIDDADDDPLPATVCDATIRRGSGPVIGAKVYAFGDQNVPQVLAANARQGVPVDFIIGIVNRSTANETISIDNAGADFNGFAVKYFLGARDATADVAAGTVQLNDHGNVFSPGEGAQLKLRVTATSATPIGAVYPCNVSVRAQNGSADIVQALVKRAN